MDIIGQIMIRLAFVLLVFLVSISDCLAQGVNWLNFEEAYELNKGEPRKVFVDVYTDWCSWCKVMDRNTFANPHIAEYLNKNYYPVKLNGEHRDMIVLGTDTFRFVTQGSRGYHELAGALLNGQLAYPSVVFLDETNRIIHIEQGYVKPKQFDMISTFIGSNFYQSTPWESFVQTYVSPVQGD